MSEPYRVSAIPCPITDGYVYNQSFKVVQGKEFFVDGRVCPPPGDFFTKRDGTYRTKASGISHTGLIYADSDANVALAMARLLKCRGTLKEEQTYMANQKAFVGNHLELLTLLLERNRIAFADWRGQEEECEDHHDDPHGKMRLRIQALIDVKNNQVYKHDCGLYSRLWLRIVDYKMKKDEFAKPGKVPRMIGDLGVAASLQGFRVTEFLKRGMAIANPNHLRVGDLTLRFCKTPSSEELEDIFEKLINPPTKYYFVYFSDDSCLSIRHHDGTVSTFNIDISGCDGSHTSAVFDALIAITPEEAREDVRILVEQCTLPIRIRFKGGTGRDKLVLQPVDSLTGKPTPRLYSGSTITTVINNLACILGAVAVQEAGAETADAVIASFATAGYKVTVDVCRDYSDIQFLKNSPAYDITGELRSLLNIGVLLRTYGTCKGDYPGSSKESLQARHDAYQAGLLRSTYPRVTFPLLDAMKQNFDTAPAIDVSRAVAAQLEGKALATHAATFSDDEVFRRYRLTGTETAELSELAQLSFGQYYASHGISKILEKDYGLTCAFAWSEHTWEPGDTPPPVPPPPP